jgi:hypothetical protein
MNKYFLLVLAIVFIAISVGAQDELQNRASSNLDRPVTPGWWRDMKITMLSNTWYDFNTWGSIVSILNDVCSRFPTSDLATDMEYFLSRFTGGAEVYNMTLGQGDSAYVTELGEVFEPDSNQYYDDFDVSDTGGYTYYAGRNTSLGTNTVGQLEITTGGRQYTVYAYGTVTPIVLDLDGNGKLDASGGKWLPHTLDKKANLVAFDINGDGFEELVEWIGSNDGLLITYNEGEEVSGNNLYGTAGGFASGFEKLSLLDKNNDKKLTGDELATLSVWQDKNGNAIVDSGEVTSLSNMGITCISLAHDHLTTYFTQNGKNKRLWDWNPVTIMVKRRR